MSVVDELVFGRKRIHKHTLVVMLARVNFHSV